MLTPQTGSNTERPSTDVADRQRDRQTDDMQSQDCALHCSVSRGKNVVIVDTFKNNRIFQSASFTNYLFTWLNRFNRTL